MAQTMQRDQGPGLPCRAFSISKITLIMYVNRGDMTKTTSSHHRLTYRQNSKVFFVRIAARWEYLNFPSIILRNAGCQMQIASGTAA